MATGNQHIDMQLAVALADLRAQGIAAEAAAQAQTVYINGSSQSLGISAEAQNQVAARVGAADAEATAIRQIGSIQAETVQSEASSQSQQSGQIAQSQVQATQAIAKTDAGATKAEAASQSQAILGEAAARSQADAQIAQGQAQATIQEAGLQVNALSAESQAAVQVVAAGAATHASRSASIAAADSTEAASIATSEASATIHAGTVSASSAAAVAASEATATTQSATNQAASTTYGAQQGAAGSGIAADSQARLVRSGAYQDHQSALTVAITHSGAADYAADDQYKEAVAHEDGEDSRLQTKLNYADEKFDQVWPIAQRAVGLGNSPAPTTIGLMSPWPVVPNPVPWTPRMIQIQANLAYASSDQQLASQFRAAQADVSGRGFSSNSPFVDAIRATLVGRAIRQSGDAAAQARITTARQNVEAILEGQKLRGQVFTDQNQAALASEGNAVERQVGLIRGVATIVAGLT